MKKISFIFYLLLFIGGYAAAQSYCLSLGTFSDGDARGMCEYLLNEGLPSYVIYGNRCELRLGPLTSLKQAQDLRENLLDKYHIESSIIMEEEIDDAQAEDNPDSENDAPGQALDKQTIAGYSDATARRIISLALNLFGEPYKYGGTKPGTGIDCSFFVQNIYKQLGIYLPRTSREQFKVGRPIKNISDLKVGDLLFFKKTYRRRHSRRYYSRINHVGIYIGGGEFIHATLNVKRVTISRIDEPYYHKRLAGIRRVLLDNQMSDSRVAK